MTVDGMDQDDYNGDEDEYNYNGDVLDAFRNSVLFCSIGAIGLYDVLV